MADPNSTNPVVDSTSAPAGLYSGLVIVSLVLGIISFVQCGRYLLVQKNLRDAQRHRDNLLRPVDTTAWVDTSQFNGQDFNEGNLEASGERIHTALPLAGTNVAQRKTLPSDLINTREELMTMLELYYSFHHPIVLTSDLDKIVELYFKEDHTQKRMLRALSTTLKEEFGESLNKFISRMQRGDARRPPKNPVRERRIAEGDMIRRKSSAAMNHGMADGIEDAMIDMFRFKGVGMAGTMRRFANRLRRKSSGGVQAFDDSPDETDNNGPRIEDILAETSSVDETERMATIDNDLFKVLRSQSALHLQGAFSEAGVKSLDDVRKLKPSDVEAWFGPADHAKVNDIITTAQLLRYTRPDSFPGI